MMTSTNDELSCYFMRTLTLTTRKLLKSDSNLNIYAFPNPECCERWTKTLCDVLKFNLFVEIEIPKRKTISFSLLSAKEKEISQIYAERSSWEWFVKYFISSLLLNRHPNETFRLSLQIMLQTKCKKASNLDFVDRRHVKSVFLDFSIRFSWLNFTFFLLLMTIAKCERKSLLSNLISYRCSAAVALSPLSCQNQLSIRNINSTFLVNGKVLHDRKLNFFPFCYRVVIIFHHTMYWIEIKKLLNCLLCWHDVDDVQQSNRNNVYIVIALCHWDYEIKKALSTFCHSSEVVRIQIRGY